MSASPSIRLGMPVFGLAIVFLYLISGATAGAAPSAVRATSSFTIKEESVKPNFPYSVDFTLNATGFTATSAVLSYKISGDPDYYTKEVDMVGPTSDISLTETLDMGTDYIPPDTEVEYYWSVADAGSAAFVTPHKKFSMVDERFRWQSLSDKENKVTVHWYAGANDFGTDALAMASRSLDRLQKNFGVQLPSRARLWIYASDLDMKPALPSGTPEWVGGLAYPAQYLAQITVPEGRFRTREMERTIPHELSHLVLGAATAGSSYGPPDWLNEGLAVHSQEFVDPNYDLAPVRVAAHDGKLIPIRDLDDAFNEKDDLERVDLAYAESRSIAEFIMSDRRYGTAKLAELLKAYQHGADNGEAFQSGLGVTVDDLDKQWQDTLPFDVAAPRPATKKSPSGGAGVMGIIGLLPGLLCFTLPVMAVALFVGSAVKRRRAVRRELS